jgi:hypothetical protein
MTLLELETSEEHDAVLKILKDTDVFISNFFLGAKYNEDDGWSWINGGEFSYEPSRMSFYSPGTCMKYSRLFSSFYISLCNNEDIYQLICEKEEIKDVADEDGSPNESPVTEYNEPEDIETTEQIKEDIETTEQINEPETVGPEHSEISNKISILAQNTSELVYDKYDYSYPASAYLMILAGIILLVIILQIAFYCCY